jgi:hypothetical protein
LPAPLAPAVIVIQDADVVAVQAQPLPAETAILRELPPLGTNSLSGATVYSQADAPAWVTVWVCPPTVIVPDRDVVAVFAATRYVTVPLPVPEPPAVMEIQLTLLEAVHWQAAVVVTEILPGPPAALKLPDAGLSEYAHGPPWIVKVSVNSGAWL